MKSRPARVSGRALVLRLLAAPYRDGGTPDPRVLLADYANPALRLRPEWTQWRIERTGLDGDAAARSRQAARSAASAPVHDQDDPPAADDKAPFRRQESTERIRAKQKALLCGLSLEHRKLPSRPPGWLTWSAPVAASVEGDATGEPARGRAMKAMVQHEYGAPQDVLRLAEVEMPAVGAEDVLVSVRASSANPWDWHFIRGEPVLLRPAGLGGVRKPKFAVPGGDLAGTVERAGSSVASFRAGR